MNTKKRNIVLFEARRMALLVGIFVVTALIPLSPAFAQDPFSGNPVAKIARELSPAVVNIDVEAMVTQSVHPFVDDPFFKQFFGEEFKRFSRTVPMKGRGSGFIVSKKGTS